MKIRHRIVYDKDTVSKEFIEFLKKNNAKFENNNSYIGAAYLFEEGEWKDDLYNLLKNEKAVSTIDSIYSKAEFEEAQWYSVRSKYRFEYPQPEDAFGYESYTYENSNYCGTCGCGLNQVNLFRINKVPRWGNRHFLMLNWIEDELFTSAYARECIIKEKILGLKFLEVMDYKKNISFDNIYQIYVEGILEQGLIHLNQSVKDVIKCSVCGNTKYIYSGRGLTFNKEVFENTNCDIVKTFEIFGDGHMCARIVIVSKKLYQVIKNNKLDKDLEFEPINLD